PLQLPGHGALARPPSLTPHRSMASPIVRRPPSRGLRTSPGPNAPGRAEDFPAEGGGTRVYGAKFLPAAVRLANPPHTHSRVILGIESIRHKSAKRIRVDETDEDRQIDPSKADRSSTGPNTCGLTHLPPASTAWERVEPSISNADHAPPATLTAVARPHGLASACCR
ncbi:hypothetical protein ACFXCR_36540, partial [Streptomyces sp. NPDC059431]